MFYLNNYKSFISAILLSFALFLPLQAREFTFFLAGDPHYGYEMWSNNEKINKQAIKDMNQLPGKTYGYPNDKEVVEEPNGVLVAGDLTGSGSMWDWGGYWIGKWYDGFDNDYEVNGNGRLRYPVYEGYGNHDIHSGHAAVLQGIYYRNQARSVPVNVSKEGLHYSWDWDDVHFVNLNLYPGGKGDARDSLTFLRSDLKEQIGNSGRPIILYFHYDFWSEPGRWWTKEEQDRFYDAIKAYNVAAIFVGHIHHSSHRIWNGIDVFTAPTVKDNKYFVVHVKDSVLTVSERIQGTWGRSWSIDKVKIKIK